MRWRSLLPSKSIAQPSKITPRNSHGHYRNHYSQLWRESYKEPSPNRCELCNLKATVESQSD